MSAIESRAKYWKKSYYNRVNADEKLSGKEAEDVLQFWEKYYPETIDFDNIFHRFYKNKSPETFNEMVFPVDLYYCYVDPYFNNWDIAKIIDNKALYPQLFADINQPITYFNRRNDIWVDGKGLLSSKEKIEEYIDNIDEIIVKQANFSEGGVGVFFISGDNKKDKFWDACRKIKTDIVVQESVKQNVELSKVNPTSINTIRILSLLNQNNVKIYSTILRMGVNNSRVDNISQGGIACGVKNTGQLKNKAYNWKGEAFSKHPTTGVDFETIIIPNFKSVCDLVKNAHPLIPEFRLVSWDIAINDKGIPLLIEANLCYGELNLHQLNNGPIFGNDTEKILKEVFQK